MLGHADPQGRADFGSDRAQTLAMDLSAPSLVPVGGMRFALRSSAPGRDLAGTGGRLGTKVRSGPQSMRRMNVDALAWPLRPKRGATLGARRERALVGDAQRGSEPAIERMMARTVVLAGLLAAVIAACGWLRGSGDGGRSGAALFGWR